MFLFCDFFVFLKNVEGFKSFGLCRGERDREIVFGLKIYDLKILCIIMYKKIGIIFLKKLIDYYIVGESVKGVVFLGNRMVVLYRVIYMLIIDLAIVFL